MIEQLDFLAKSVKESLSVLKGNAALGRSILTFHVIVIAAVFIYAALIYIRFPSLGIKLFLWTFLTVVVCTLFFSINLSLLKDGEGRALQRINTANMVTLVRIYLVPSISLFLFNGFLIAGSSLYAVAVSLDIVDGFVARRIDRVTRIGVMLDPLGDIFTTLVAFLYLRSRSLVPEWLFIILVIRYTEFFIGIAILAGLKALPQLKATLAGKVAAIVQGVLILFLLILPGLPDSAVSMNIVSTSYYVLSFVFISVIISQSLIGINAQHAKRSKI